MLEVCRQKCLRDKENPRSWRGQVFILEGSKLRGRHRVALEIPSKREEECRIGWHPRFGDFTPAVACGLFYQKAIGEPYGGRQNLQHLVVAFCRNLSDSHHAFLFGTYDPSMHFQPLMVQDWYWGLALSHWLIPNCACILHCCRVSGMWSESATTFSWQNCMLQDGESESD
jgi:hypothetical protein